MSDEGKYSERLTAEQIAAEIARTKKKRIFGKKKKLPERIELGSFKNFRITAEGAAAGKNDRKAPSELEARLEKQRKIDEAINVLAGTHDKGKKSGGEPGADDPELSKSDEITDKAESGADKEDGKSVSYGRIEAELTRVKHKREFGRALRDTVIVLLGVAAAAVLVSMLFLPVLRVTGTSMEPTLKSGEIVVCAKNSDFSKGDIVAFYFNNKVLLKRVIGIPGDVIDISESGQVTVNGEKLDEKYAENLALGETDLEFPIQVPESRLFVLGDNRETSVDSRSSAIGYVAEEYIIGRVIFRAWPLDRLGTF